MVQEIHAVGLAPDRIPGGRLPFRGPKRQFSRPAETIASRICRCVFSLAGVSGRRTSMAHLSSNETAYLHGTGFGSTTRARCRGKSRALIAIAELGRASCVGRGCQSV